MRKFVLLGTSLLAFAGLIVAPSAAQAVTVTLKLGNTVYSASLTAPPPTGTVSARFGTIAARCGQTTTKGSPGSPSCTTYTVTCPASAVQCDATVQGAEQALSGGAGWVGFVTFGNYVGAPYTQFINGSPYTCTANHCGQTAVFEGIQPGETMSLSVFNISTNLYPGLTGKIQVDVNS